MDVQPCLTSNAQQLRVVRQLLWDVISLHLYPAERDEIRRALGGTLLDENETMFAEAGALADILGDVQINTAGLMARHQLCSNPQRSMVEGEIRLLIDRLHSSASVTPYGSAAVRERDPDSLLPRSDRRDKALLDYVTTVAQIVDSGGRPPSTALPPRPPTSLSASSRPGTSSRPQTSLSASASITLPSPLSRPGTASPTLHGSRPSTGSSAASSAATRYTDAPSVVAGVADKLNVATIEVVRDSLRGALQEEQAALLEDIEYLQGLLEAEADLQVRAAAPPPSLAELRDYSHRLAAVVADEESRVEHEVRVSAMFAAADQQQSRPGRLRGMVDASRRPPSAGALTSPSVSSSLTSLSPVAAPAGRRSISGGDAAAGGGGSVQTLVVHGGDDDAVRQQKPQPRRSIPPPTLSSSESVGASVATAATGAVARAPAVHAEASGSLSAAPRAAPLAAVRRPGSGGSGVAPAAVEATPLPPVLATPTALRPAQLPAVRGASGADLGPTGSTAAAGHRADSNGLGNPASSSGRLRQPSPGRLLQPGLGSGMGPRAQHQQQQQQALAHPHPETSPSISHGSPARASSIAGTAGPHKPSGAVGPGPLRPLLPRSGSVGPATSERSRATSIGCAAPMATGSGTGSSGAAARTSSRTSSNSAVEAASAAPSKAAPAAAAASAGTAVAARLGATAAAAAAPELHANAVQPRALLGNKHSIVEKLEEEVDAVKGGVAAILERYNVRTSTPPTAASSAPTAPGPSGEPK